MRVEDFDGVFEVCDTNGLDQTLARRFHNAANGFLLMGKSDGYPRLDMLVKDELAVLHFFPEEYHPGYIAQGDVDNIDPNGTITFILFKNGQEQTMYNGYVVSLDTALKAAEEFFYSQELPKGVEWEEL